MEGEGCCGVDVIVDNVFMGYMLIVGVMEEVFEKLKLFDYEMEFCK